MKTKRHFLPNNLANPRHPIFVSVAGVGGTGSHVLNNLAQISHAFTQLGRAELHVTAYDPDIVSETNVGRQLFSPADINRNKAVVLIERINRFYGFGWNAIPEHYFHEEPSTNIIISCVDTLLSRESVYHTVQHYIKHSGYYYRQPYYWMDIGNERNYGQVVMGTLYDSEKINMTKDKEKVVRMKTFFELFKNPVEENIDDSCSAHTLYNKQNLFINKFMATFACNMLWELFHNYYIDYQGCYVNLERFLITKIPIK